MGREYVKPQCWLVRIGDDVAEGDGNLYESTGYTYGPGGGGGGDFDDEFDVKEEAGGFDQYNVWNDVW